MPIVLALGSALIYGVADYCGGRASRVHPSAVITFIGQLVSFLLVLAMVLVIGTQFPDGATVGWSLLGGAAGAIALASLYHAFANGSMSVVAPLAAVVGAVLPVGVGIALGERPSVAASTGIVVAIASVALISGAIGPRERPTPLPIIGFAVVAGIGFGILFVAFERADSSSGLWPIVMARVASLPILLGLCVVLRARPGDRRSVLGLAVIAGVLDVVSNTLYLEAARTGLLSEVAVVSSLYPASTVVLALWIDGERVNRWQALGMGLAAAALVLVALGRA